MEANITIDSNMKLNRINEASIRIIQGYQSITSKTPLQSNPKTNHPSKIPPRKKKKKHTNLKKRRPQHRPHPLRINLMHRPRRMQPIEPKILLGLPLTLRILVPVPQHRGFLRLRVVRLTETRCVLDTRREWV